MAKVVIVGAGFAGHTAAMYLGKRLGRQHEITMINKFEYFYYIPSWVWVGVGTMQPEQARFPLEPVYHRMHVNFIHGAVTEVHPDDHYVVAHSANDNEELKVDYDYLIIATGPKLNYEATPGLGPKGHTFSICTEPHAVEARDEYFRMIERMKAGEDVRIVVGTGHPSATCQGAAFEYITNIHKDLLHRGLRDKADLLWLSNEPAPGDFGVGGMTIKEAGETFTSEEFIEAVFRDSGIRWEVQKGVKEITDTEILWEDYEGIEGRTPYDFAMLIPAFAGQPLKYIGANGEDVSAKVVNAGGFVLVDAFYGLDYDRLIETPAAWPAQYQNPTYRNIFAAGIAFAPPGPISRPHITPNGYTIAAAPPRTGMVSGIIGRIVALNVGDLITKGKMTHQERMTEMSAACIASMGNNMFDGTAAVMIIYPVVPNHQQYPETGRDTMVTHMEMGLSGAWMKRMIHETMIYKLKGNLGWQFIPE